MKRKLKKISIISAVFLSGILFFSGCSNKVKEQMDLAMNYLNSGKYNEAKNELEVVLKENSNNSEAKLLIEIISDFETAKKLFDDGKINKANEEVLKIPKEYSNYDIKNEIENLKSSINKRLEEIKQFNNNLDKVHKLISDGKLEEAKKGIDNIKNENLTTDQVKKVKDLEDSLNKKIDEKKREEKLLKEKKQKELEEKKKEEEIVKQNTPKKKETNINSKNEKGSNSNSNKNQSKSYVYVNNELGLQMTIPASWNDLYTIKSDNDGIYLSVKHKKSNPNLRQGFLFAVTKRSPMDDEDHMDSVGRKRYIKAKGVAYIIWGPTGLTMGEDNPDWDIYRRLNHQKYSVADTVKAIL
ncbi:hypothetical protein [Clostridium sardiniense]|uniref:hypothetical protein n=1 Tax=Clostridium sardiniense TaxID=29369 RepID=UPI003D357CCD